MVKKTQSCSRPGSRTDWIASSVMEKATLFTTEEIQFSQVHASHGQIKTVMKPSSSQANTDAPLELNDDLFELLEFHVMEDELPTGNDPLLANNQQQSLLDLMATRRRTFAFFLVSSALRHS